MDATDEKVKILPNVLITGTPGTGKSFLCQRIAERLKLTWLDCSKIAKEHNFLEEYDEELECPIIDEDKLLDYMEPLMQEGGKIVEYHGSDFFPKRWFQAVFVLRCSNTLLYDRLKERGYNDKKLESNMNCEIFGTILEEALDSYDEHIVHELKCETKQDEIKCIKAVRDWMRKWNLL